jgi:hypothetical protein
MSSWTQATLFDIIEVNHTIERVIPWEQEPISLS